MAAPLTFAAALKERLRLAPGEPLVTAYDVQGRRVELSATTYANWVAKTANLLVDEFGLEAGDTVRIDLPPTWLGTVFVGAAMTAGLAVTTSVAVPAALVACGPNGPSAQTGGPPSGELLACSLHPFALPIAGPVPSGAQDYGLLWPGQPDALLMAECRDPDAVAWLEPETAYSQAALLTRDPLPRGTRLLTNLDPLVEQSVPAFLAPLAAGGSVVLAGHLAAQAPEASQADWSRLARTERADTLRRAVD